MKDNLILGRRAFIKTGGFSLAGLFLAPVLPDKPPRLPDGTPLPALLGRVTRNSIPIYAKPDSNSPRTGKMLRDEVVELKKCVMSELGPAHNPRWYQVEQGYIHSAFIQCVENNPTSSVLESIPIGGILGQVTIPITHSFLRNRQGYWVKLYRLYYSSLHWITGLEQTPSGEILYQLTDEWLRIKYYVPAEHIQPLSPTEYVPLSDHVTIGEKHLEVSLKNQTLTAYEDSEIVRQCLVSTGVRYMETPRGNFQVLRKFPSKHMGNGGLTSDPRAYELIGVPWTTFFHEAGIAFHGTYWHNNFGIPMSHGCVNMTNVDAHWLFRWTAPFYRIAVEEESPLWKISADQGTKVIIY